MGRPPLPGRGGRNVDRKQPGDLKTMCVCHPARPSGPQTHHLGTDTIHQKPATSALKTACVSVTGLPTQPKAHPSGLSCAAVKHIKQDKKDKAGPRRHRTGGAASHPREPSPEQKGQSSLFQQTLVGLSSFTRCTHCLRETMLSRDLLLDRGN